MKAPYTSQQTLHSVPADFGHIAASSFNNEHNSEVNASSESYHHQQATIQPTGQSTWTRPPIFLDLPGNSVRYSTGSVAYTERKGGSDSGYYHKSGGRHLFTHGTSQNIHKSDNPYSGHTTSQNSYTDRGNLSIERKMNVQTKRNQRATVVAGTHTLKPVQRGKLSKW